MIITTLAVNFPSLEDAKFNSYVQDVLGGMVATKFNVELVYSDEVGYSNCGIETDYSWLVLGLTNKALAVEVYNYILSWFKKEMYYIQVSETDFISSLNRL